MQRFTLLVLLTLGLTFLAPPASAQQKKAKDPDILKVPWSRPDEVHTYKTIEDTELKIHVFLPDQKTTTPRKAAVFFHGGGWVSGAPGQFFAIGDKLSHMGLVTFHVQYRLIDKKGPKVDPSTQKGINPTHCIQDVRSAMRWIRSQAEQFHIDPNFIAAGGGSAGGHLACATTLVTKFDDPADDLSISPAAQLLLLFNPVYNNDSKENGGWGHHRAQPWFPDISPAHQIRPDLPPTLVMLGDSDPLIPVSTAKKFQQEMEAAGNINTLVIYPGATHGFFNHGHKNPKKHYHDLTFNECVKFLKAHGFLDNKE